MLRPASRRASQQNASPDRPYPSPYESGPAPYRPDRAPYGPPNGTPDREPYGPPDRAPYGPPNGAPDRAPYGPPNGAPDRAPYGPPGGPRGRGPYGPPDDPRGRAPYGPPDHELDTQVFPRIPGGPVPGEPDDADGGPVRPPRAERRAQRRARRRGRIRRLLRRRTVQVILALIAVFCCWLAFSVGSALAAPGGGSMSSKLAEWARDHYLGPVVTFGEWLTYQPPKAGGKPAFSLAVPSSAPTKYKHVKGFQPIIPKRLASPAGTPLAGEGQWRVLETVKGQPAMFSTLLRPSSVYTSYVAGIISIDQRLVRFQLRPGAEDPGPGNWKAQPWIKPGTRTGLIGTFNGGFKLDSAGGGFYLNGITHGVLAKGAASVVYYRNGTIKIGVWGRDVKMTSSVVGVRQNLKLIVDHGQVPASVNQDVETNWGATLGGGYYVWRSGMGITKDGRVIFVYGPALNVQELADLLHEAGAVEALQLDINPEWTSFEYYKTNGHPSDPTPVAVLPNQEASAYRYYSVFSRDFTAVYAR
ncbi:MAG TPA: phosphodiester glycosidase family protein [Streptosporangiaceae bacterium]|nr:phosphodiester glycosidase family protein [Streptosporangiaceae bacterium]